VVEHRSKAFLCNGLDIRSVARTNDTACPASYAPAMTDRIGKEHTMKRIAAIGAVVTAFAVAPSLAAGGNFTAEVKSQVSTEVVSAQVARVQVAKVQRAQAAVAVQRHLLQTTLAQRLLKLRPQIR
jgi:hypothetical protein